MAEGEGIVQESGHQVFRDVATQAELNTHIATAHGLTQAYVGYNTVGASTENITATRQYMKKITIAVACLLTNIEVYMDNGNGNDVPEDFRAGILTDNAGAPDRLISALYTARVCFDNISGAGGNTTPRWFGTPIGQWLAAGDYWLLWGGSEGSAKRLYYDAGSDQIMSGGGYLIDAGFNAVTDSTRKYSVRANTIR